MKCQTKKCSKQRKPFNEFSKKLAEKCKDNLKACKDFKTCAKKLEKLKKNAKLEDIVNWAEEMDKKCPMGKKCNNLMKCSSDYMDKYPNYKKIYNDLQECSNKECDSDLPIYL